MGHHFMRRFGNCSMLLILGFLSSCSSFDFEVLSNVDQAAIRVDPSKTTELSQIDVSLSISAGKYADQTIILWKATLNTPDSLAEVVTLGLAFPDGFDPHLRSGEVRAVALGNKTTTNKDLAGICKQSFDLNVWIANSKEPDRAGAGNPFRVTVDCP